MLGPVRFLRENIVPKVISEAGHDGMCRDSQILRLILFGVMSLRSIQAIVLKE